MTPSKQQLSECDWCGFGANGSVGLIGEICRSEKFPQLFDWYFTDCAMVWRSPHSTTSVGALFAINEHMKRYGQSIDDLRWTAVAEATQSEPCEQDVYFVKAGPFLKIGIAQNVAARVGSFSTACPYEIELVGVTEGGAKKEKELHRRFKDLHFRGEWFRYEGDLVEYVESLRAVA